MQGYFFEVLDLILGLFGFFSGGGAGGFSFGGGGLGVLGEGGGGGGWLVILIVPFI